MFGRKSVITPGKLKVGDSVGVIAPSDVFEREYLEKGVKVLEGWGLKVVYGRHLWEREEEFAAGRPADRFSDLMEMVLEPKVKVVWAALGGYAATQLWSFFDAKTLETIKNKPKWFIGYSDVSSVLNVLCCLRMVNIYGPNLSGLAYWNRPSQEWLKRLLFGEKLGELGEELNWKGVAEGKARGRLIATNLDSLLTSMATRFDPIRAIDEEIILAFEEVAEFKSAVQRKVDAIFASPNAGLIKGLVIGRMIQPKSSDYPIWAKEKKVYEIVRDRLETMKIDIPVAVLNDFGHQLGGEGGGFRKPDTFYALPSMAKVEFEVKGEKCRLTLV